MKLQFSRASLDDLVRLRDFIAEHNPAAAKRISEKLVSAIESLVEMPQRGRPVENFDEEIRELIFGKYVIRYMIQKKKLSILRIWHGKEDR